MKTLALIVVLSLVVNQAVNAEKNVARNKPGRCPQLIDFLLGAKCPNPCKSDMECSGSQKCCLSDCGGNECMEPDRAQRPMEPECKIGCPRVLAPVCGTDGVTYSNWCMLNYTTCNSNQRFVKKDYDGECSEKRGLDKPAIEGPCKAELMKAQQQHLIGSMRPQCNDEGFYLAKQCHPSTGYCWCADSMGKKISEPGRARLTEKECQQMREK